MHTGGMVRRWTCCIVLLGCAGSMTPAARAQLSAGTIEGSAVPPSELHLRIVGPLGLSVEVDTDAAGRFFAVLPYGLYTVVAESLSASCRVRVRPLETTRCDLQAGETRIVEPESATDSAVHDAAQYFLFQAPGVVSYPLDFANLANIRLPAISYAGLPWTTTSFRLNGLDATDSYQPGVPVMLDDVAAEDVPPQMTEASEGIFLRGAEQEWHFGLATANTGAIFSGNNLPPLPDRGSVERPQEFRWFTRDTAQVSGPLSRWADISATATGQWASQTAPLGQTARAIGNRVLLANARGSLRPSTRDRIDALYSGSRLDLTSGGWAAGMEAVLASPMMPSFYAVDGFANLREVDHFDLVQVGWTRAFGGSALEIRYGYSTAHLDTASVGATNAPGQIDLLDPVPQNSPISNYAVRTRHQARAAYQGAAHLAGLTHSYTLAAGWEQSQPRNRFQTPGNEDLISAAGTPAFVVQWNTPADTRARIESFTPHAEDLIRLPHGATLNLGFLLDIAEGRAEPQTGASTGSISWESPSPRASFAVPIPRFSRATLRAGYQRTWLPLAGRYLDFANPDALSGLVYGAQSSQLLECFGGAYSSISADLKRPHADEFRLGLDVDLPSHSIFSVSLLRRDQKDEIAAINTGVPPSAFSPVVILDPGPDSIPGTFDDQKIVVYAQNPATLGHDQYLLTNPTGLRELTEAFVATAGTRYRSLDVRVSFTAEKSFGPTNPGNGIWENDPGIVGSLYSNPNTLINATGHPFLDRAFVGKFQAVWQSSRWMGRLRFANVINYLDGLPFARELLVTGLPQGPFLLDATLRGSPEGGNRAQHVLNWNLRASRNFEIAFGRIEAFASLLNLLNNGNKILENDLSGPSFEQRPALAFPPPRTLEIGAHWQF